MSYCHPLGPGASRQAPLVRTHRAGTAHVSAIDGRAVMTFCCDLRFCLVICDAFIRNVYRPYITILLSYIPNNNEVEIIVCASVKACWIEIELFPTSFFWRPRCRECVIHASRPASLVFFVAFSTITSTRSGNCNHCHRSA